MPSSIPPLPAAQKAVKIQGPGQIRLADGCPLPQLRADEILVHVVCVAINPVDGKSTDLSPNVGATSGCDFAGEVVCIGSSVRQPFIAGDPVAGCVFGNNPDRADNGAFAEYVTVPSDLVFRIPADMTFQAAATLGVGLATVGMALYQYLGLPLPLPLPTTLPTPTIPSRGPDRPAKPCYALVYGGGTATGRLAVQMLHQSGVVPVTACSPRSFDAVKALGAAAAFDYHSVTCGADIRTFTDNSLAYALDCITDTESMKICYAAIGSRGGRYLALDPFPIRQHTRRLVQPDWIIAFSMFNQPIRWKKPFNKAARPQDRVFAGRWFERAQEMLDTGVVVPHPNREGGGGLAGVIDGVDRVRKGEVAGVKLVYRIR